MTDGDADLIERLVADIRSGGARRKRERYLSFADSGEQLRRQCRTVVTFPNGDRFVTAWVDEEVATMDG